RPPPHANCLRATPSGNWHTAQKSGQFENHESGQIQKLVTNIPRPFMSILVADTMKCGVKAAGMLCRCFASKGYAGKREGEMGVSE
ncbi:MAG: hypothetical protein LBO00_00060, partial [Zoogloeaceae bacterium]|nr:hypothetical protein [Zoogloeaceae bacterium]